MLILPTQLRLDRHSIYGNGYYVTQVLSVVLRLKKLHAERKDRTSDLPVTVLEKEGCGKKVKFTL